MDSFIINALPLAPTHEAYSHALPEGFPLLVDGKTLEIVEPVCLFLCSRYLRGNRFVKNSAMAAANDLKDWWGFLSFHQTLWSSATRDDVNEYRDGMLSSISPFTHKPYAIATIRRRLVSVLDFYRWAANEGYISEPISVDRRNMKRLPMDSNPLAHLGSSPRFSNDLLPRMKSGVDDHIHLLTPKEYKKITSSLGPLPSESEDDSYLWRDRLACDLALTTGMRVDEIVSLSIYDILNLAIDDELSYVAMRITRTKGLVPRKVLVPVWLVKELLTYIHIERDKAVRARHKVIRKNRKSPVGLFVNHFHANRNPGENISVASLQNAFRAAVTHAGLSKSELLTNPDSGENYVVMKAAYSFHDLRHTFAIWTYHVRKKEGDAEPWKFVQALLGHAQLSTTLSIYLRVAGYFENVVSDRMALLFRSLLDDEKS